MEMIECNHPMKGRTHPIKKNSRKIELRLEIVPGERERGDKAGRRLWLARGRCRSMIPRS